SDLAALLSIGLGIGNAEEVALAAMLHDIGLTDLPGDICSKSETERSKEEQALYQTHPELSLKIIKERKIPVTDAVMRAILEHHERFDGSGFPRGLAGKRVSVEAQIIALSTFLDQWCSVKPGQARKEPLDELEKIFAECISNPSKAIFDPKLIGNVLSLFKGSTESSTPGVAV
ncbi:MAG: HD domain-containing phosphohydrolase, partial [Bdellovibrionota bacterium]